MHRQQPLGPAGKILVATALWLLLIGWLAFPKDAHCFWCTPTFCAFDVDCDQLAGCSCSIPIGDITGTCR